MNTIDAQGPAGERGKTGDHGQHGDAGETGPVGETGARGIQGVPGVPGRQGLRGRALTWAQALAMFLLILLIGLVMAYTTERQQHRLEVQQTALAEQQAEIQANAQRIAENRYQGCLGGVKIIERFNAQMRDLAAIERRNTSSPLAKERIKAYESGITPLPDTPCQR